MPTSESTSSTGNGSSVKNEQTQAGLPVLPKEPAGAGVQTGRQYFISMSIICGLFFVFGFVTWLNGVLIPFLQLACDLTDAKALLVTFAFYMAYFCLALPASAILAKTGFKKGMALGLAVMAVGALLCIPAAGSRSFALFLTGLFVQGTGLALLQTASNPYASVIGPIESAAQRISIMGICNKVAGVLGSLLFATLLLGGADSIKEKAEALAKQIATLTPGDALTTAESARQTLLNDLAQRVVTPYIVIIVVLLLLAFFVLRSPLPEIDTAKSNASATASAADGKDSLLHYPHLFLGVLCLFLYLGVEVMAGDAVSFYGKAAGMPLEQTKFLTSVTLAAMVVGYIAGIVAIPRWLKQENALAACAVLGALFTAGAFATSGVQLAVFGIPISVAFVCLLGFANSVMWPAIFPLAIAGIGRFTNLGSAFLIMAIAGGAIIPQVYAHLPEWFAVNAQSAFIACMLPCYAYILFYALRGCKVRVTRRA